MSKQVAFVILQELVSMLEEEELKSAILVVLANKQDIEGAMSVTEVGTIFAQLIL